MDRPHFLEIPHDADAATFVGLLLDLMGDLGQMGPQHIQYSPDGGVWLTEPALQRYLAHIERERDLQAEANPPAAAAPAVRRGGRKSPGRKPATQEG